MAIAFYKKEIIIVCNLCWKYSWQRRNVTKAFFSNLHLPLTFFSFQSFLIAFPFPLHYNLFNLLDKARRQEVSKTDLFRGKISLEFSSILSVVCLPPVQIVMTIKQANECKHTKGPIACLPQSFYEHPQPNFFKQYNHHHDYQMWTHFVWQ